MRSSRGCVISIGQTSLGHLHRSSRESSPQLQKKPFNALPADTPQLSANLGALNNRAGQCRTCAEQRYASEGGALRIQARVIAIKVYFLAVGQRAAQAVASPHFFRLRLLGRRASLASWAMDNPNQDSSCVLLCLAKCATRSPTVTSCSKSEKAQLLLPGFGNSNPRPIRSATSVHNLSAGLPSTERIRIPVAAHPLRRTRAPVLVQRVRPYPHRRAARLT